MAFQLRGISPKIHDGKLMRFNVWTWHRIWLAFQEVCPELVEDIEFWYANNGEVVDEDTAKKMADKIESLGDGVFARIATSKVTDKQQHNVSDPTLISALEFEFGPFVDFLRNCGGFKIT